MTMNNSKKYGIVLLINIGLLVFFIFSCYLYNHRQVLMDTTFYYEIPVIDKVLTINTPVFNDYAYVRIETNKSYTLKKCADLKIVRRETTDVSLIFIIGNVKSNSILEIWNSKEAKSLYEIKQEDFPEDSLCHSCGKFKECRTFRQVCYRDIIRKYGSQKWYYPDVKCPYNNQK